MSREKIETYCFAPSESLRSERAELTAELMEWLMEKAAGGARPIPLRYALLDVAEFAGGFDGDAEKFWEKVHRTRKQSASCSLRL